MPVVSCPHCQRPLNVPESAAGGHVRCPLCQGIFAVAAPPPVAPVAMPVLDPVTPEPPPPRPVARRQLSDNPYADMGDQPGSPSYSRGGTGALDFEGSN